MTRTCVFCGQEIAPDEEVAGRGAAIAHARCADAALADDAHWDAIAAATDGERDGSPEARRGGCLALAVVVLGTVVALGAAVLTALRRPRRR